MIDDISVQIENVLLEKSVESALIEKEKESTRKYLLKEIYEIKKDIELMDLFNLRLGPYVKDVLDRLKVCQEVLSKNTEQFIPKDHTRVSKTILRVEKIVNKKLSYGKRVNRFLEAKENSLIESIKSNLLQTDLDQFDIIRKKLLSFKNDLRVVAEKLEKAVHKAKALKPTPEVTSEAIAAQSQEPQ